MGRVAVVGAGISGLSTACFLAERHEVIVLEAADRAGGNVVSERIDGRVVDHAANGWLSGEPALDQLLALTGLSDQQLPASDAAAKRFVWAGGRLHPVPMSPPALLQSRLFSWSAKLRLFLEPFIGRFDGQSDETIAAFVTRRLGKAFVDRMVAPMVAGVFGGDPDKLSLASAFPRMRQLEDEHRSLILAAIRLGRGGAPRGHLTTMKGGAGALTAGLAGHLGDRVVLGNRVQGVERHKGRWLVHHDGESDDVDAVVLATPARVQAGQVRSLDHDLGEVLDAIPYAPIAVVVTAWPDDAFAQRPEGFGVLRARGEDLSMLGTLFTSNIFPDHGVRGEVLLRTMIGGAVDPAFVDEDDDALLGRTRRDLERMFGGVVGESSYRRVLRHPRGIPQYTVGHRKRVKAIRAAETRHEGLFFVGNHLEGVGVKDCARNGEAAGRRVERFLE